MRRFRELVGQAVMDRDQAARVGTVASLVVDAAERRVVAVRVRGGPDGNELIDWSAVTGAGPDAVVVTGGAAFRGPGDERDERAVAGDLELLAKRVLTDAGVETGEVDDVEFDEGSGEVSSIVTTAGPVAADRLRSVGRYAVVIRA